MKTTYLNLHNQPNRRAEFWSCEDDGPVLVINYREASATVQLLQEDWLQHEDFCVHICSTETAYDQPTDSLP